MPIRSGTRPDYDEAYGSHHPIPGRPLTGKVEPGYIRSVCSGFFEQKARTLVNEFGWDATTRAVIQVIHFVSTLSGANSVPDYNWKTLADWKALLPADTFVQLEGQVVL